MGVQVPSSAPQQSRFYDSVFLFLPHGNEGLFEFFRQPFFHADFSVGIRMKKSAKNLSIGGESCRSI
ncbi:hypothetical protein [Acidaminobacterium chupaoyuni]